MNRPDNVTIEDLVDPVFPAGVGEALAAMEHLAPEIDWSVEEVWRQAELATGLAERGDDLGARELALLVDIGRSSSMLRGSGRMSLWTSLVHNATQRLLIVDYLGRHPEIHEIDIDRPIVIAGQPRTGTTHLHNLIAADPDLRSLPYWEAVEPVPPLVEQRAGVTVDGRVSRTEAKLAGLNHALPHFKRMHDMDAAHVHEEIQLMTPAFGSMLWETSLSEPAWRDHYLATDQRRWYEWMRTVLQVCAHVRGGPARWVLKSPQHVEQFDALMATFPDATVVCTHRDPVAVTSSIATMITYTARTSIRPDRLGDVGRYWIDRTERMFRACVDGRDGLPAGQVIDVRFDDFMADEEGMVQRIYDVSDQPLTPAAREAMREYRLEHPRGRHGRVRYGLAPFGASETAQRQSLAFYADRFGV